MKYKILLLTITFSGALSLAQEDIKTCGENQFYNNNTMNWQVSVDDPTFCQPVARSEASCADDELIVRTPSREAYLDCYMKIEGEVLVCLDIRNPYNQYNPYTQYPSRVLDPNYAVDPSKYKEVCIKQEDPYLRYVLSSGSFYYVHPQVLTGIGNGMAYQYKY